MAAKTIWSVYEVGASYEGPLGEVEASSERGALDTAAAFYGVQRKRLYALPASLKGSSTRQGSARSTSKPAALFASKVQDEEMSWKSADPLLRNWRVDTRATSNRAAAGSRWEAVSGKPNSPSVTGVEARSLYSKLVSSGHNHVRLVQRHPRDAHLERVVSSTESVLDD
jgi:hypothetical protein